MSVLHIVHCIDTEGPLTETLEATFARIKSAFNIDLEPTLENLEKLQSKKYDLQGREASLAKMIAPKLLEYNSTWDKIRTMLLDCMSPAFREKYLDDFGQGWVYSWHCMDHMHYKINPRRKALGYGKIFKFYKDIIAETSSFRDEINWHFHPRSLTDNPLHAATSYLNSSSVLLEIICRRILEDNWFPTVNRPGFHAERPDAHAFLEQWIPFDYANQSHEDEVDQPDLAQGRFGDWRWAPTTWRGYHPAHDDYQQKGNCRRKIFRCLNVGTRTRTLNENHVLQAFKEAEDKGNAILAFADHDYRDIRPDVKEVRDVLARLRSQFSNVKIRYSGAEEAARALHIGECEPAPELSLEIQGNKVIVTLVHGQIFGPQPFLAIKDTNNKVYHDNFDIREPGRVWTYTFEDQTLKKDLLKKIGVAAAGRHGRFFCKVINF